MEKIFICGMGGHSKVLADIVESTQQFELAGFVSDEDAKINDTVFNTITEEEFLKSYGPENVIIGVGDNAKRKKIVQRFCGRGFTFPNLVHPSAVISASAILGCGNVIMPNAVVNSCAVIGDHCILNTGSIVEHDCCLGDYVSCSPGSVICGSCDIKEGVFVGANASVIQAISVGQWAVIGSQSTVVAHVRDRDLVCGVPARVVCG